MIFRVKYKWIQTPDRQIDGNGTTLFSRGHDTLRKYDSGYSLDELDYYIFLAYAREEFLGIQSLQIAIKSVKFDKR